VFLVGYLGMECFGEMGERTDGWVFYATLLCAC